MSGHRREQLPRTSQVRLYALGNYLSKLIPDVGHRTRGLLHRLYRLRLPLPRCHRERRANRFKQPHRAYIQSTSHHGRTAPVTVDSATALTEGASCNACRVSPAPHYLMQIVPPT